MTDNPRQTRSEAASAASEALSDSDVNEAGKSAAGSALSQAPESTGQTTEKAASAAGETLSDSDATDAEKSAAASSLSQTPSQTDKD